MSSTDTSPTPPADQAERERILGELDGTLFVEAGAGTGKTTALVGRIVELVARGTAMSQIAAITFTEAAASELKDRVRQELDLRHAEAAPGAAQKALYRAALDQLDGAALQTLHAFAQRILSSFPLEAGLPPRFEVADEIRAGIGFNEDWARLLDEMLSGDDGSLARAFGLRLNVKHLKEIALAFNQNLDRMELAVFDDVPTANLDVAPILSHLDAAESEMQRRVISGMGGPLVNHITGLRALRAALRTGANAADTLSLLANHLSLNAKRNAADNAAWGTASNKDEAHEALRSAEAERQRLVAAARAECLMPILRTLQQDTIRCAADRRARGVLQFDDLLLLATKLLRGNSEVRRAMAARFRHILIDEFQDTDPLQLEIATLLAASEPEVGDLRWDQIPVHAGKLFFVGDPKQSIYRFRRADILLYQEAEARFGARLGELLNLTANFRSRGEILEFVNLVFSELIGEEPKPGQPGYVRLTGGRAAATKESAVHLVGRAIPKQLKWSAEQMREAEATDLVKIISAARGNWEVATEDGGTRPARLNDIAILVPTRTAFRSLERALEEAEIPFRLESRSLLYGTQEVTDLTNVLAAIDDPTDEVSVVAALRSPAFGCSDDELYEYVKANGRWDYTRAMPETPGSTVPSALRTLAKLHGSRWWYSVSEVVERVIRERRLFEVAFANRRPRESWQRLRFVLEQARGFGEAGGTTLRQFVEWLRTQAESGSRVTESVAPEADDDAVRVMTIHAAKGLEFPIVVLAGLDRSEPVDRSTALWATGSPTPEVRVGSLQTGYFDTPGFEQLKEHEKEMGALQDLRLYYVATTRARDHLIVSLFHKEAEKNPTFAAHTYTLARVNGLPFVDMDSLPPARVDPLEGSESPLAADALGERAAWQEGRAVLLAASARSKTMAATAIAKLAGERAGEETGLDEKREQNDPDQPWRRGRAGTSIGRAVHAVLQSVDLASGEGLEDAAGAQSVAEGIPGRRAEIVDLAQTALRSAAVRAAVASGRFWREVYVAADAGGTVIEGFIDLLYETPQGLVVVDYKTDEAGDDEQVAAAMKRYQLQGAAYALALERAMPGRRVEACTFVFVRPGPDGREERVADLPAAMRRVSELLAAPAAAFGSQP